MAFKAMLSGIKIWTMDKKIIVQQLTQMGIHHISLIIIQPPQVYSFYLTNPILTEPASLL